MTIPKKHTKYSIKDRAWVNGRKEFKSEIAWDISKNNPSGASVPQDHSCLIQTSRFATGIQSNTAEISYEAHFPDVQPVSDNI